MRQRQLAIVVPVRQDWRPLQRLIGELGPLAASTIVVSVDPCPDQLPAGVTVLAADAAGRGQQLAQGVAAVTAEWYWLLHADSRIGSACVPQLEALMRTHRATWGRFDVALEPRRRGLDIVAGFMNLRSRLTGICTGDQGVFVHHSLLAAAGGVPPQPLMEDIELSARLRRLEPPTVLPGPLGTSARRWNRDGIVRTVLAMWGFRLRYWAGASPQRLADDYYGRSTRSAAGSTVSGDGAKTRPTAERKPL